MAVIVVFLIGTASAAHKGSKYIETNDKMCRISQIKIFSSFQPHKGLKMNKVSRFMNIRLWKNLLVQLDQFQFFLK
jgi:hypothetical protein